MKEINRPDDECKNKMEYLLSEENEDSQWNRKR